jgi:hypothetical protein
MGSPWGEEEREKKIMVEQGVPCQMTRIAKAKAN